MVKVSSTLTHEEVIVPIDLDLSDFSGYHFRTHLFSQKWCIAFFVIHNYWFLFSYN